jgi:L-asparaginase II
MTSHPDMVAGPGRFDTALMSTGGGKIVCKGGAEGYMAIGVLPGALGPGSEGLGITVKVSDGDLTGRARPVVALEILRQLGVLDETQLQPLAKFYTRPVQNWRGLPVGQIRPCFQLNPQQRVLA